MENKDISNRIRVAFGLLSNAKSSLKRKQKLAKEITNLQQQLTETEEDIKNWNNCLSCLFPEFPNLTLEDLFIITTKEGKEQVSLNPKYVQTANISRLNRQGKNGSYKEYYLATDNTLPDLPDTLDLSINEEAGHYEKVLNAAEIDNQQQTVNDYDII